MIKEAVRAHPGFSDCSLRIYAKGSYANNTNVRADSDVDIAVQCTDVIYWQEAVPDTRTSSAGPYTGRWTPALLRSELKTALEAKFPGQVDSSGSTAFRIDSGSARVEADVVPCFDYRYYMSSGRYRDGAKVIKTDGRSLVNYPEQQLSNGKTKNTSTNLRYKKAVRVVKRLENAMVTAGGIEVPSFLMECLVYNTPNAYLTRGTWTDVVRGILGHVYNELDGPEPTDEGDRWYEVNGCKFLFHDEQKWTRGGARQFAADAWSYLGLS
ncbi:nucleotidyltransferase domain-containing protein [Nocardioides marmoriginsengisoli]|nr:nucleotidyltransferase [Nocardioides marmoriginsengisoli]